MSLIKTTLAMTAACLMLAGPLALATSGTALAKKLHRKHVPTSTENKQTPTGGQAGGGAGRS